MSSKGRVVGTGPLHCVLCGHVEHDGLGEDDTSQPHILRSAWTAGFPRWPRRWCHSCRLNGGVGAAIGVGVGSDGGTGLRRCFADVPTKWKPLSLSVPTTSVPRRNRPPEKETGAVSMSFRTDRRELRSFGTYSASMVILLPDGKRSCTVPLASACILVPSPTTARKLFFLARPKVRKSRFSRQRCSQMLASTIQTAVPEGDFGAEDMAGACRCSPEAGRGRYNPSLIYPNRLVYHTCMRLPAESRRAPSSSIGLGAYMPHWTKTGGHTLRKIFLSQS